MSWIESALEAWKCERIGAPRHGLIDIRGASSFAEMSGDPFGTESCQPAPDSNDGGRL